MWQHCSSSVHLGKLLCKCEPVWLCTLIATVTTVSSCSCTGFAWVCFILWIWFVKFDNNRRLPSLLRTFLLKKVLRVADIVYDHFHFCWPSYGKFRNRGMLWREIFIDMKVVKNPLVYGPLLLGRFSGGTFLKNSRKCASRDKPKNRFSGEAE